MSVAALVLCAGHGRRLRPLTDATPKPLLPVLGRPLVTATLDRLAALGLESATLNLHHRGDELPRTLGGSHGALRLEYSPEAELLGTLGALAPLKERFATAEAILLVNGDSFCRWPLERLLRRHRRRGAAATLLLTTRAAPDAFGGGVGVDRRGRIVSFRRGEAVAEVARWRVFAGAHVLSPALLARVPNGPADIIETLYRPLLRERAILESVTTRRRWHDLGTPRRYLEGVLAAARGPWPWARRRWIAPGARVDPSARLRRVVMEEGARIEAGARLVDCLLLPGCRVRPECELERVVVGPETVVPAGTHIRERLLTRPRPGQAVPAGSSRIGELVLSSLEPV